MAPSFRRTMASDLAGVRALIVRSMGHWPRDAAYLAEAEALMSIDADDLERDEAWLGPPARFSRAPARPAPRATSHRPG